MMLKNPLRLSLRMQLLTVMLAMLALIVGTLIYLQEITEDKVFNLIQNEINSLTTAIEISVEQIQATGSTDEARLKDYIDQLKKRGVEEVSILSDQQEVIMSSDPQKIGTRLSVSKNEFLINAVIGDNGGIQHKKLYSAFVPIISKRKLEGYVHVSMYFDNLDKLSREMLITRVAWTLLVFCIGVIFFIIISRRYTKPIPQLIEAIESISQGKMPVLPKIFQMDMSGLADSLGDMIKKLEEQRTMEEKLKCAQHQAMMAQLASGIAHEIRNPLNLISLSIDHLGTFKPIAETNGKDSPADLIRKTKTEIQRMNQMVKNFLDLGRELVLNTILMKVDLPVEEAIEYNIQPIKDRCIHIERDYCDPIPLVEIDIDKMTSCFQNLIANAIDAMPNGGMIKISVSEEDGYVKLVFKDNGEGINPENLSKVFEPYFTTKTTGVGLGLAIVKRIVEAHHGKIDIMSTPGKETRVRVLIPFSSRR